MALKITHLNNGTELFMVITGGLPDGKDVSLHSFGSSVDVKIWKDKHHVESQSFISLESLIRAVQVMSTFQDNEKLELTFKNQGK